MKAYLVTRYENELGEENFVFTTKENALKKFIEMVKEVGTVFHYDSRLYNVSEEELKEITDGDYYEYGGHTVLIKEVELIL